MLNFTFVGAVQMVQVTVSSWLVRFSWQVFAEQLFSWWDLSKFKLTCAVFCLSRLRSVVCEAVRGKVVPKHEQLCLWVGFLVAWQAQAPQLS